MRIFVAAIFLLALAACGRSGEPVQNDAVYRAEFRARGEATCRAAAPAELAAIGRWSDEAASGIPMICGCTLELGMAEKSSDQLKAQSARDLTAAERADQREMFTVCVDEYLRQAAPRAPIAPRPGGDGAAAGSGPGTGAAAAAVRARARARIPLASLISPDDYPAAALRNNEQGRVAFTLEIGPDGRVSACNVRESSGSAALDSAACRIMRSRARYDPARDARGIAVAGSDRAAVIWRLPTD